MQNYHGAPRTELFLTETTQPLSTNVILLGNKYQTHFKLTQHSKLSINGCTKQLPFFTVQLGIVAMQHKQMLFQRK